MVQRRNDRAKSGSLRLAAGDSCFLREQTAMKAITKVLAGGVAIAALATAAPAAAQYYPGYGGVEQVLAQIIGGGQGYGSSPYGYGNGVNSQAAVNQCVGAVQQRLNGGYGGGYNGYGYGGSPYGGAYGAPYGGYGAPYGGYGAPGYGNGGYGNARVLGISRVEPRSDGGLTVRGVANSGRGGAYAYGTSGQPRIDLTFRCKTDYRGFVYDVDINPAERNYNYGNQPYSPYNNDYSQYGYRRY
jgi:hypothetical protein